MRVIRMRPGRWGRIGAVVAAGAAALVGLAACGAGSSAPGPPPKSAGQPFDNAMPAQVADATLVSTTGRRFSLSQFAGKVVVLSDFMSLCQESCPMDTANVVAAARAVQKAGYGDKVRFVSLTIDPTRDTLPQLRAYRKLYAPAPADWVVATSTASVLTPLWKSLGVSIEKTTDKPPLPRNWRTGTPLTFDLTHSDNVFFFNAHSTEKFMFTGVPHVSAGAPMPAALMKFMDAEGHENLADPGPNPWTETEELQTISWLLGHHLPGASTATASAPPTAAPDTASTAARSSRPPGAPPATGPVHGYHTTAVSLGGQVTGCTPSSITPAAAGARLHLSGPLAAASAASCGIRGHTVIIVTFADQTSQSVAARLVAAHAAYYATGPGWLAVPTPGAIPAAQQAAAQDIGIALDGRIDTGSGSR